MSFESAAANQTSTNPWAGAAASTGQFDTGQGQGNHSEVTVGRDQTGAATQPAAKDAVKNQGGGQDSKSPPPYYPTREELIADVQGALETEDLPIIAITFITGMTATAFLPLADVLIGNAGVAGTSSPLGHTDPKFWDNLLAVYTTANFQLIRCMEPLLQKSDAGRAVFVTSSRGIEPKAYWGPYAATKAALESLVLCYADEIRPSNLRVNLLDPGKMRTLKSPAFSARSASRRSPSSRSRALASLGAAAPLLVFLSLRALLAGVWIDKMGSLGDG